MFGPTTLLYGKFLTGENNEKKKKTSMRFVFIFIKNTEIIYDGRYNKYEFNYDRKKKKKNYAATVLRYEVVFFFFYIFGKLYGTVFFFLQVQYAHH